MQTERGNVLAPFTSTRNIIVQYMLKPLGNPKGNILTDIGSGTLAIAREAARPVYGFERIFGIENNKERVERSQKIIKELKIENVEIIHDDVFNVDLSKLEPRPNRITMYLTPQGNYEIRAKLDDELEEGTMVASNHYGVDGWNYSERVIIRDKGKKIGEKFYYTLFGVIYFYEMGKTDKTGKTNHIVI